MKSAEEIVRLYQQQLYKAAMSITLNREDALDMVQETFIKWITKRPEFESDEHEKAWLLRVTMNASINLVNSKAHSSGEELLDIYPAANEEEYELLDSVAKLPPKYRKVIHLYYYEGYSVSEIASLLGEKEVTVRSHMNRARTKLKGMLEDEL